MNKAGNKLLYLLGLASISSLLTTIIFISLTTFSMSTQYFRDVIQYTTVGYTCLIYILVPLFFYMYRDRKFLNLLNLLVIAAVIFILLLVIEIIMMMKYDINVGNLFRMVMAYLSYGLFTAGMIFYKKINLSNNLMSSLALLYPVCLVVFLFIIWDLRAELYIQ